MPSGAGHRGMLLHRRSLISVYLAFGALASFRRRHLARCLLFGRSGAPANTPWNRVKLALGFGTSAASRAIKSSGLSPKFFPPVFAGISIVAAFLLVDHGQSRDANTEIWFGFE